MKIKYLALALIPFALAACQSTTTQQIKDVVTNVVSQQNASQILPNYTWSYQPAGTNHPVSLSFDKQNQRLSIDTGCNMQSTTWSIANNQLITGNLASTMKACEPALMQQEQNTGKIFNQAKIPFTITWNNEEQPVLNIVTATGEKISLKGELTDEAKYQSAGEIIFLEIAPETRSCVGVGPQTCLQVREIKYDNSGVKTYVNKEWHNFYDSIKGFEHTAKQRNILRVKRFEIKNPAADQSKYAYVLDMVVESEQVK
ncbi:META and DUF4377 domain-containing protein [Acinetobacter rudis]|uniref:META and DUF4377 domain-containing protein n=1 Tax=Acinetobacter rudis TaxID=632955 RepID=A0AAW8J7T5_9GAMM|nr:META and DUF4377 domain-containing protein [Acinetobacter rudis]MDQ8934630.1 META and DUF4377 domain-containing protein [Acinetobacter rudis]MDQ9016800.1 META and DUF4377 domain-containing protein [Acinetobacter rudis]